MLGSLKITNLSPAESECDDFDSETVSLVAENPAKQDSFLYHRKVKGLSYDTKASGACPLYSAAAMVFHCIKCQGKGAVFQE